MLTSKERAELRAQANGLDTTLMVGKGGVTEQVVLEAVTQLEAPGAGEGPGAGGRFACGQGGAGGAVRRHRRGARVYCGLQIRPVPGV